MEFGRQVSATEEWPLWVFSKCLDRAKEDLSIREIVKSLHGLCCLFEHYNHASQNIYIYIYIYISWEEMVYCSASIRRFATHNGWWYRACPSCYKQLKEKENSNEFLCVQHGIQTALPCYRVYMTIEDADNQATVMLMGRQAEQFFGSSCQD